MALIFNISPMSVSFIGVFSGAIRLLWSIHIFMGERAYLSQYTPKHQIVRSIKQTYLFRRDTKLLCNKVIGNKL